MRVFGFDQEDYELKVFSQKAVCSITCTEIAPD